MRIGIVGAGMIGSTLAKLWADAGHEVRLASRHPEELRQLVRSLGKNASAGTAEDAAKFGEVVMLTVPLKAIPGLAKDLEPLLGGEDVLGTGKAYQQRGGDAAGEAIRPPRGSAGWTAGMFPGARGGKAFNRVYFKPPAKEAHRSGDRVGIPLAGDDREALEVAERLAQDAGFDPVPAGPLERGR